MPRPLCFGLMPFGKKPDAAGMLISFDAVYEKLLAPAIRAAEMEPLRADEEMAGGIIHKPMFERLVLCEYAVADLTTSNADAPLPYFAHSRGTVDLDAGIAPARSRDFARIAQLHEAVLDFVNRHRYKVDRHSQHGVLGGLANCLHIFLAAAEVLRGQFERIIQELDGGAGALRLSMDEWGTCRDCVDAYCEVLEQLLSSFVEGYLVEMVRRHEASDVAKIFDGEQYAAVEGATRRICGFRDRLEQLRPSIVVTGGIGSTAANYSRKNVLHMDNWSRYERQVAASLALARSVASGELRPKPVTPPPAAKENKHEPGLVIHVGLAPKRDTGRRVASSPESRGKAQTRKRHKG
jgi:hypothetical protein